MSAIQLLQLSVTHFVYHVKAYTLSCVCLQVALVPDLQADGEGGSAEDSTASSAISTSSQSTSQQQKRKSRPTASSTVTSSADSAVSGSARGGGGVASLAGSVSTAEHRERKRHKPAFSVKDEDKPAATKRYVTFSLSFITSCLLCHLLYHLRSPAVSSVSSVQTTPAVISVFCSLCISYSPVSKFSSKNPSQHVIRSPYKIVMVIHIDYLLY